METATALSGGETTVLLVDDEINILQALQRLLRRETFRIVSATSGEEALKLLEQLSNVALILSDQRMPQMNGAELLRRSREISPESFRVLLTGYSDLGDAVDAVNRGGISRYLNKPWDDSELLQIVRSSVENYSLTQENKRLQVLVNQQNLELQDWNRNLKDRVLQQTSSVRRKSEELQEALRKQKDAYQSMISSLISLVEMRGTRTRRHAENVARLSSQVAVGMGLAPELCETIRTAALLHDVGEIGLSERILIKMPESLNQEEFSEYSLHPVRAQILIDPIEELRPAGVLIRHHHEKFDGSGFPDGLAGEAIPLGARIIAYADLIDRIARQCVDNVADQALQRTDIQLGTSLDPALRSQFHKFTRYAYFPGPKLTTTLESGERDIRIDDLESGMTLSRSVYSGSGLLLLQNGVRLDARNIEALRRYRTLDPFDEQLFVCKPGRSSAGTMV